VAGRHPIEITPFLVKSHFHPPAGQLNQLLPNIGFVSFFGQLETFTCVRKMLFRFGQHASHTSRTATGGLRRFINPKGQVQVCGRPARGCALSRVLSLGQFVLT
jgi:hypothetical protein